MSNKPSTDAVSADATAPEIHCPSCGLIHVYRTANPYRPFCSKGCKAIDLGAWAAESYRVEAKSKSAP